MQHVHDCVTDDNLTPVVLQISLVPRPPPFFVLRFLFSIIHRIILNENRRTKNGGGLGTRLTSDHCISCFNSRVVAMVARFTVVVQATV